MAWDTNDVLYLSSPLLGVVNVVKLLWYASSLVQYTINRAWHILIKSIHDAYVKLSTTRVAQMFH